MRSFKYLLWLLNLDGIVIDRPGTARWLKRLGRIVICASVFSLLGLILATLTPGVQWVVVYIYVVGTIWVVISAVALCRWMDQDIDREYPSSAKGRGRKT